MIELSKLHLVAIGGFDPSGGAGILRDGLTARTLGSSFRLVGTAWAEQSPVHGVQAIDPRPASELRRAIQLALREAPSGHTAIKIGMVVNPELVQAVLEGLDGFAGPVVFDPVLGATAGGALFDAQGEPLVRALEPLIARTWVVTPNTYEAAVLCEREISAVHEAEWCAHALAQRGARAVVVKGGHLGTDSIIDVLVTRGVAHHLEKPRLASPEIRGTGCSYASSLALYLAAGRPLPAACDAAQAHVADAIRSARPVGDQWHLGHS